MSFLSKVLSLRFDEDSRRNILTILGIKIKLASKALTDNEFQAFKDSGGDITKTPKATGLYRVLQLANLEILKQVDEICKQNNLNLWLTFGTLLGALRHKGYIPWDDDIDVEMMRDDYNKLIEILNSSPNLNLQANLMHATKDTNIFLKISHKNIPHIFIDITPLDELNKKLSEKEQLNLSNKIKKFRRLMNFKILGFNKKRDIEGVLAYIAKKREQFFKFSKTQKIENSDLVWGIDFQHKVNKYLVYSNSTYFPLKEIEFEGINFKCPNNLDEFLTKMYGNYMSWPSKLYAHHLRFKKGESYENYFTKEGYEELSRFLNMTKDEIENL